MKKSYNILDAAIDLARMGFRVFPVHGLVGGRCTCGRADCRTGKHPRIKKYSYRATCDLNQINKWFEVEFPNSNIGITTGKRTGIWVLDVDIKNDGFNSLDALEKHYGKFPPTVKVKTGGGGEHYYFRYPAKGRISSNAGKLGPGLDVRGTGGYVLGPGSIHVSGEYYKWIAHPNNVDIAYAPDWLIELLSKRTLPKSIVSPTDFDDSFTMIEQGTRNITLFSRVACHLRDKNIANNKIMTICLALNQFSCTQPLDEAEVRQAVESAFKYPKRPSRTRRLSDSAEQIYDLLLCWTEEGTHSISCSIKEIALQIGITPAGARKCIKQLVEFEKIIT